MPLEDFQWPTSDAYELAMRDLQHTAIDSALCTGSVAYDDLGNIAHFGGASLNAAMYKVTTAPSAGNPSGDWMIRCFCSTANGRKPPGDIKKRYREISKFCLANLDRASALLPVTYVERGIRVDYIESDNTGAERVTDTKIVPVVKMPFLLARSLGSFVTVYHQDAQMMERLCTAWLRMMRELKAVQMAHGDLDLTNVLVEQQDASLTLKLIDYDNVWISALSGLPQTEHGHEGFQHPAFMPPNPRPYDAEMDRFASLVIYISLRAIGLRPHLYKEWGADDAHRLLLAPKDFAAEATEENYVSRITQLRQMGMSVLSPYLDELSYALQNRCMPCNVDEVPLPPTIEFGPRVEGVATEPDKTLPAWEQGYVGKPVGQKPPVPPTEPTPISAGSRSSAGSSTGRDTIRPGDTSYSTRPAAQISVSRDSQQQGTTGRGGSRIGWIILIVFLLLLVLVAVLWTLHLGPFSPPPSGVFTHILLLSGPFSFFVHMVDIDEGSYEGGNDVVG